MQVIKSKLILFLLAKKQGRDISILYIDLVPFFILILVLSILVSLDIIDLYRLFHLHRLLLSAASMASMAFAESLKVVLLENYLRSHQGQVRKI